MPGRQGGVQCLSCRQSGLPRDERRVAFELDGAAFHFGAVERGRDMRRDATLAALGIMVVRYSYARLMILVAVAVRTSLLRTATATRIMTAAELIRQRAAETLGLQ